MARSHPLDLSRRERQIMEILYRLGEADAATVQKELVDSPSYSAVRAHLASLERKRQVSHRSEGQKYVYRPVRRPSQVRRNALGRMLETFFDNSVEQALASLIDVRRSDLSEASLDRLAEIIEEAKAEARSGREEPSS